jgi:transposase-like protein
LAQSTTEAIAMEALAVQIMTVECEFCHQTNELVANYVSETQEVHCSRCGGEMGTLKDLRIDTQPETLAAAHYG